MDCMPTPQARVRKPGQHALRWRRSRRRGGGEGDSAQWWSYKRDAESNPKSRGGSFRFRVLVWFLWGVCGFWSVVLFGAGWDGIWFTVAVCVLKWRECKFAGINGAK